MTGELEVRTRVAFDPSDANVVLNGSFSSVVADPRGLAVHNGPVTREDDEMLNELGISNFAGLCGPANSGTARPGYSWQPTSIVAQVIRYNKDSGGRGRSFGSWASMVRRCYDKRIRSYQHYGAIGIKVCKEWLGPDGFRRFIADMGQRPSLAFSIDRYPDPCGGYSPRNCRWATAVEQANNKRPRMEPFSMKPMTDRQAQILRFVAARIVKQGFPPTLREIGEQFGIRSTNGVADHLRYLVRKGMLKTSHMKSRGIALTVRGWDHAGGRKSIQSYASTANRAQVVQPSKCQKCGADTFDLMMPCVICRVIAEESAA